MVQTLTNIPVGQEFEAATQFYDSVVDGLYAPACQSGFVTTSEGKAYTYKVEPDSADYTKSKIELSAWNRVGCTAFGNNTAIIIAPTGGTGGSGGSGSVDFTATNDLLNQIKVAVNEAGNMGDNQGVVDAINNVKALLGTGGVANPNDLLTSIKGILDGIDSKDIAGNQLLTEISDILQSGGTGGTGESVNVDMTATNGILTGISDLLTTVNDAVLSGVEAFNSLVSAVSGNSGLGGYVDNTASKPGYTSSFFEAGTPTVDSYKNAFNGFTNDMKFTPLFGLVGGFFGGAPTRGSSVVSFNGGVYGSHSYDFSSWGSVLTVLRGIILVIFASASMRIIFLKGGG